MAATLANPDWDAENGVWKGDKAMTHDELEIPKPLVIFGYGSLCWKPDSTLESFESFPCVIRGWARLFAQRSTDHRGTPGAPGLVVTLCQTSELALLPGFDASKIPTEVTGKAYVVPDNQVENVLADLDFREKGGYCRRVVDIEKLVEDGYDAGCNSPNTSGLGGDSSIGGGDHLQALLYSGTIDNPNFWWGPDGSGLNLAEAARIIATAEGPSGKNVEYLMNLHGYLESLNRVDVHVATVKSLVEEILSQEKEEPSQPGLFISERKAMINQLKLPAQVVRCISTAHERGVDISSRMTVFDEALPTASAAAAKLDICTSQIMNSLIFEIKFGKSEPRRPILVCAPGDRRVDTKKLAALLGVSKNKIKSATAAAVLEYTGYEAGGVGPCGFPETTRLYGAFVDERCLSQREVWCGGGVKPAMFRCTPAELLQISGGTQADLAEGDVEAATDEHQFKTPASTPNKTWRSRVKAGEFGDYG